MIFGCHLDITLKKNLMLNRHKHIVESLTVKSTSNTKVD